MAPFIEITTIKDKSPLLTTNYEKEERKADHLIEINETNGQDRSGLQTDKSAKQFFGEKFKDLNNSSINSTTIFRVTAGLRESNPDAYKPKLISIGPYHYKNSEFRSMEKYKLMYLQRFLQRKEGLDVESCISELEELKDEALKCYDYDDLKDHDSDILKRFSEMLLLDGCFVIEYIRERSGILRPEGEVIIIKEGCIISQVYRDLLLVENQLPFFILTKLHDMTKEVNETSFTKLVKYIFLSKLPKMTPASFGETEGNEKNIKHLLHIVHMSCHPSKMKNNTSLPRHNPSMGAEHSRKSLCCNPLRIMRWKKMSKDKDHITSHLVMPNATELFEAGVNFVKFGYIYRSLSKDNIWDSTSLFDIKFENGLMTIPSFEIADHTETLLRNLIAYEQQLYNVHPNYFSDYVTFMDHLIDSEKDVSLLRQKGIIENWMGDDKQVANLFNKIGNGVSVYSNFYYYEECKQASQYYDTTWNKTKANLRHNYCSSPWAGASTGAAIILLLLTATQTILAFKGGIK